MVEAFRVSDDKTGGRAPIGTTIVGTRAVMNNSCPA